ncbi:MAG: hypothetical protein LUH36_02105 [Oscillospiraceae bacterium]|nr:hypothetical protein [Oscillospiraceae bacterium]
MTSGEMNNLMSLYIENNAEGKMFSAISDCMNDFNFEYPLSMVTRGMCKHNTVYRYFWTWSPKEIYPIRAYHGIDAAFALNTQSDEEFIAPYFQRPDASRMFTLTQELLHSFICDGKPSNHDIDAVAYDPEAKPILVVDIDPHYENDIRQEGYDHLKKAFQSYCIESSVG